MTQISCEKVNIMYGSTLAVKDVSFDIEKGDYLCILGENGSGKSTLVKGLLGLMPLRSGKIILSEDCSKKDIGYLPQQTVVQRDFPAAVFEIVVSGTLNSKGLFSFYSKYDKERANFNLERLNILDIKNKSYKELSGGQQQRVLLARALCAAEKILILDEPTIGLDPIVTEEFYNIIKNLSKEGISIIMVSHDIRQAVLNANKILHMETNALFYSDTNDYLRSDAYHNLIGGGCRC